MRYVRLCCITAAVSLWSAGLIRLAQTILLFRGDAVTGVGISQALALLALAPLFLLRHFKSVD